ncbi:MAG: imidazolonepropionase [Cyclobacteriaceae bacterium]|nr:imidazolonepropionase [Cyclobacteriaceae bacterium]
MELLILNIKELVQTREKASAYNWVAGDRMGEVPSIKNAFLYLKSGLIESYGLMAEAPTIDCKVIDATNKLVLPTFVDSHTHLVFAASREEEFVDKIKGMSYADIAKKGGGILNSAKKLQQTSEENLYQFALKRVDEIIGFGTACVEIKSGYGLTVEDELKMLRVAKRIAKETPLTVKTTFLGAHAIPKEYTNRKDYIDLVINEMLPKVAEEKLADYIDVFCEKGFFTPEETERVILAGESFGLKGKIHANQLNISGGVQVGVKTNSLSVDHLESMGQEEIDSLLGSNTMPTLLPGAAFFLRTSYPPARQMIAAGLPVALATDYNPGSAPSGSMPFMLSLACVNMRMTPQEAINAATMNSAYAMDSLNTHGSITKGKAGSVIITKDIPSVDYIPYAFNSNSIDSVIIDGEVMNL